MNEFKFSCPSCHQRIKVSAEFVGHQVECPACKSTLVVPAPQPPKETTPPTPSSEFASPPAPDENLAGPSNAAKPDQGFAPNAPSASDNKSTEVASRPQAFKAVPPITDLRVALLTPEIKSEILRDVRSRLADKSHWIPGKKDAGQYNYAARQEGDALVPVAPADVSATHFSLFGAVLLEFHRRNVTRGTQGRQKFLDEELTGAIQETLGRKSNGAPVSEAERQALTHEHCLAVVDLLERQQRQELKAAEKQHAERKIEHVRLTDLIEKLQDDAPMKVQEVVCALYYELEELKQRMERLERRERDND